MILYFSATGNSRHVAERIAEATGDVALSIEKSGNEIVLSEGETLGLVTPTNWWELPVLVRRFIRRMTVTCRPAYAFVVATYGSVAGAIGADAKRELAKRGISMNAAFGVKMPDNWTPIFDLSDPVRVAAINEKAERIIDTVIERIKTREQGNHIKYKMPHFVRWFTDPLLEHERQTKYFRVEDSCIGCGLCAAKCPVKAIEMRDKRPVWNVERCALCLGCLHRCPKFAIQYGNNTKEHGQYMHPAYNKTTF